MSAYKIALISDWYLPRVGGLEMQIRDLARELCARGHEAHVICSTPRAEGSDGDGDGVKVKRLDVPLLPVWDTIRSRDALHRLEHILRAEKYDVVHAQSAMSPLALGAVYLARKLGIPSLLTEHSVLSGATSLLLRGLDRINGWCSWPDVLTAVSGYVAKDLGEVTGRKDVHVLLNAIHTEDWFTDRREELRVTSVMRFAKRKRPMDIVRMIPQVHALLPSDKRPIFTIIGDGPQRPDVEREARRLGVSRYLELPGIKTRKEIRDILARSAVFILPSYKEALSIAVIEARSAGVPVVARTPNGVGEIIQHGVNGFLAPDTPAFVGHLAQLLREPNLRAQMSARAHEGLERFGWEQAVKRHLSVYDLAITRRHGVRTVASMSIPVASPTSPERTSLVANHATMQL